MPFFFFQFLILDRFLSNAFVSVFVPIKSLIQFSAKSDEIDQNRQKVKMTTNAQSSF